jgi:4-aminobutyrate aminotransferase
MANSQSKTSPANRGAHLQQWAGSRDKNLLVLRSRPRFFLDISFYRTHEKNPVACAAALATIECLEEQRLLENVKRVGEHALQRMNAMMEEHEVIGSVKGLGLLMGMEIVKSKATRERAVDAAEQVMYSSLSRGLNFKLTMGNIITLTPPLTITQDEMDKALDILDQCIREFERNLVP